MKMITAVLLAALAISGCVSVKVSNSVSTPPASGNYHDLEAALIEEYLHESALFAYNQESDEVVIYNQTDELEYAGKPESPDARLLILKGDLLFDARHTSVYRINR